MTLYLLRQLLRHHHALRLIHRHVQQFVAANTYQLRVNVHVVLLVGSARLGRRMQIAGLAVERTRGEQV